MMGIFVVVDDYIIAKTDGLYAFDAFSMSVVHLTHIVFNVRACQSAYILLGSSSNANHKVKVLHK